MPNRNSSFKDRLKEKQFRRRELLAKQFGIKSSDQLHTVLGRQISESVILEEKKTIKKLKPAAHRNRTVTKNSERDHIRANVGIYKDSSTFLKGTQSLNPHNDYCQNYVDTGQRPQNFIRDVGLAERFGEYPKLKDLIRLKNEVIRQTNTPPTYLKCDLKSFNLRNIGTKFDVILLEPPLEEYKKQSGIPLTGHEFNWEEIINLEIDVIAAQRSFIFLWCGSSDGLDHGRRCLKRWGFRRCEDICWIKTNLKKQNDSVFDDDSLFVRTKEHCLMGIKGTVRRSTDGDFIHANVDIDLIISEESREDDEKPEEIFHIIEHFCLGRRRIHLFGRDTTIRPGWLTIGSHLTTSNFDKLKFANYFESSEENQHSATLTGTTDEIERLRPKTPPPRDKKTDRGGSGPSRGGMVRNRNGSQNNRSKNDISTKRSDLQGSSTPPVGNGFFERGGSSDSRGSGSHLSKRDVSWDRNRGQRPGYRTSRGNTPEYRS